MGHPLALVVGQGHSSRSSFLEHRCSKEFISVFQYEFSSCSVLYQGQDLMFSSSRFPGGTLIYDIEKESCLLFFY